MGDGKSTAGRMREQNTGGGGTNTAPPPRTARTERQTKGRHDMTNTTHKTKTTTTPTPTEKEAKTPVEPVWVEQLGYKGEKELVDQNLHKHVLVCDCGNVRHLAPGDVFQVDACKPCIEARRKEKRNERAKKARARRAANKKAQA